MKVFNQLNEAVANREESQELLTEDRDWLIAKLQAAEVQMEENSSCLSELRGAIDKYEGMKKMSQAHKTAAPTRKNLEKMFNVLRNKSNRELFYDAIASWNTLYCWRCK